MQDQRIEFPLDGLATKTFGQVCHAFEILTSTSDKAAELAAAGASEGTVVLARRQTSGRGRLERIWESPAGGLWMTLILHPLRQSQELPGLTLVFATAIAEAVERHCGVPITVRWPNDLYVGRRKVGGLLAEARWSGDRMEALWIGLGLNVNLLESDFSVELRPLATSLQLEVRREISITDLLKAILEASEAAYAEFQERGFAHLAARVAQRCATLNHTVRATLGLSLTVVGRAESLGPFGLLQLQTREGSLEIWSCEEIRLLDDDTG